MSAHKFQCTNLADCDKALTREIIEIEDGEDAICPDCGFKLTPEHGGGEEGKRRRKLIAALSAVIVLAASSGGYYAWKKDLLRFHHSGHQLTENAAQPTKLSPTPVSGSKSDLPVPITAPVSAAVTYPCNLSPASTADTARLLQYLKQGMNYASQKKPSLALNEFEQVLKIDPNFLGANMNIGVANLALRKYSDAKQAFSGELYLIGCLKQMNEDQLAKFAYMEEVGVQAAGRKGTLQVQVFRDHLSRAEANIHYNLACLNVKRNQNDDAIAELKQAIASGFIDKKSLETDPDLQSIRNTKEFKDLIADLRASSTTP